MDPTDPASPLTLFYSWQALALAAVVSGLMQSVKAGIETHLERRSGTGASGRDLRQGNARLNDVVLPAAPLVLGAVVAAVVPVRPEALVEYASHQGGRAFLVYALWGAVVGQFSDYLYQRFKKFLPATPGSRASTPPAAPASPEPPAAPPPPAPPAAPPVG